MHNWEFRDFGVVPYQEGLDLQDSYLEHVKNEGGAYLLLLEHERVITLGRRTDPNHLLYDIFQLEEMDIELFKVDRGGSATYHAPGQLVGYVICKASEMGGIHHLVTKILNALHEIISSFGIDCIVDHENPGIWTVSDPPRKLAALGMQNKEGYTLHGFAINIHMALIGYYAIVPCGLDLPVSTMSIELGSIVSMNQVRQRTKEIFALHMNEKKIPNMH